MNKNKKFVTAVLRIVKQSWESCTKAVEAASWVIREKIAS
jgi:hypothetical protein